MKRIYPEVEPYLTDEGRAAIEAQEKYRQPVYRSKSTGSQKPFGTPAQQRTECIIRAITLTYTSNTDSDCQADF